MGGPSEAKLILPERSIAPGIWGAAMRQRAPRDHTGSISAAQSRALACWAPPLRVQRVTET